MTFLKIIETFTFYGIDIALLAVLSTALTQLVKVTLFKKAQKKLVTFVPFIIGTILYGAYWAVRNLSICCILEEYTYILERGIAVGSVSTLYYVLYEQFVRIKSGLSETERVICALIEGYIPEENRETAAKAVAEAIARDVTGEGAKRAEEIILQYSGSSLSESDIKLLAKLIVETLAHLYVK